MYTRAWLIAGLLSVSAIATSSRAANTRTEHAAVNADPQGSVIISNVNGSIDVVGWDNRQVAAEAELHGATLKLSVTGGNQRTAVQIAGYPQGVSGLFSANPLAGQSEAHLTVHVPRRSLVTVNAVAATVRSSGVRGTQSLQSVSGAVTAEVANAPLSAHTVSGTINLHGGAESARVSASSVSGGIRFVNGSGNLEARSVSGSVQAQLSPAHEILMHTTSGVIAVTGSLARDATLDAHTISGSIHIDTQAAAGFSYEIRSFSGVLRNCFGAAAQARDNFGPGRTLSGTRGAGGARISVETLSGEVSLCDR